MLITTDNYQESINVDEYRARLLGSLLLFTQTFYKIRTGRDFIISQPVSRESHYITISRSLTDIFYQRETNSTVNMPPRYGKTEESIHFIPWAMAHYPDCNFIYVCYSLALAVKATQTVRDIIALPHYKKLFGVEISETTSAKNNFETTSGGSVYAVGTGGTITGRGAGVKGVTNRFSGMLLIDDPIKPDEASSDTVREGVNEWFDNTASSRLNNGKLTPICIIGQRTHEYDLFNKVSKDESYKKIIIPALDKYENALDPSLHTREDLLKIKETNPYVFAAQYQQDPQPSGGGIFKTEWFCLLDEEPDIIASFITADTAETSKDYNDASVFSFWGLYQIKDGSALSNRYALHLIDCVELRVEPKDLQSEFMAFYADCSRYKVRPQFAAIEKKSTGATLISVLSEIRGLQIREIERSYNKREAASKTARFLEMQPYVAEKLISLPRYGKHTHMCLEHMRKITANNSHRFDDICDTVYDAVKIALIDKSIYDIDQQMLASTSFVNEVVSRFQHVNNLRRAAYARP